MLLNDSHGTKVWDIAKTIPHAAGFSHVASGTLKREGGKAYVESIDRVLSVDLVGSPATTQTMFESQDKSTEERLRRAIEKTVMDRQAQDSAFVQLKPMLSDGSVWNAIMDRLASIEMGYQLGSRRTESTDSHSEDADRLLRCSTLPDWLKPKLRPSLLRCADVTEMRELLHDWSVCQRMGQAGVRGMGQEQQLNLPGNWLGESVHFGKRDNDGVSKRGFLNAIHGDLDESDSDVRSIRESFDSPRGQPDD